MTNYTKYIGQLVYVAVDRKLGSFHPKYNDIVYLVNYGYVNNTISGDGEEIDAYILNIDYPLDSYIGRCIAVIERIDEDDPKLIIVPEGMSVSDEEIEKAVFFQEQYFRHKIIR